MSKPKDWIAGCARLAALALPLIVSAGAMAQPQATGQPAGGVPGAVGGAFSRAAQSPIRYTLAPQRAQTACAALRELATPAEVTIGSAGLGRRGRGLPGPFARSRR